MAKILVVDDINDVADSFAELLTLFGHDVRVAYSAAQALGEIELCFPDVVLMDISMPVVDGFQLARLIRHVWGTRMRLVAHTAYSRASVAAQAAQAGFDSFVSKSAQPLELALAIQGRAGAPDLRTAQRDRRSLQRFGSARRSSGNSNGRVAA
jgi:CheY-like chemotaxis protein